MSKKVLIKRGFYLCALMAIFCISFSSPVSACNVSLVPGFQSDKCEDVDTLWLDLDSSPAGVKSASFKIGYNHNYVTPSTVIKDPVLSSNESLSYVIYPGDSITIDVGILVGVFHGPGNLAGIILAADNEVISTSLTVMRSVLRDTLNQDISHTSSDATIQIDCTNPTVLVTSPPSGGIYNTLPALTIHLTDNLGLNRGYYQMDGCAGAWTQLWSYNSGSSDTTISWTVPSVSEGVHTIYFKIADDAGNVNSDTCTYSWSFTYDSAPPTVLVPSPPSGGAYNYLPALTIHLTDNIGLNRGYCQIDSCRGGSGELVVEGNTAALWHFNENTGSTVYDETANNNDGTISGATWTTGRFGYALDFDGTNDYITVPDAPSLDVDSATGTITMEAWVYPHSSGGGEYGSIIAKRGFGTGGGPCNYQISLNFSDGNLLFYSGHWPQVFISSIYVPPNEWSYVAVTLSATEGRLRFYRNGALLDSTITGAVFGGANSAGLYIGVSNLVAECFDGIIDEVRITKRVLTSPEIAANYAFGAWTQLWSYNSGSSDTTIYWTVPGVSQGLHNIYFKVTDDAGNINGDTCSYSWSFAYDTIPPPMPQAIFPAYYAGTCDSTPTFIWTSSDLKSAGSMGTPVTYTLHVLDVMILQGLAETTYTIPDTMALPDTCYWWRVEAVDLANNHSGFQQIYSFIEFLPGDANVDRVVNVGDIVYLINYLYKGGTEPYPMEAGDANGDQVVNVGDIVYLINYLYKGGPPPTCNF